MGCDIHVYVEVKINDKWYLFNQPKIDRYFELFTKMCGIKSTGEIEPISQPRGLPDDISDVVKFDYEVNWKADAHSMSWLSDKEAGEVQRWYRERTTDVFHKSGLFGYLFGNSIDSYIDKARYKHLFDAGYQEARVVFWFDN